MKVPSTTKRLAGWAPAIWLGLALAGCGPNEQERVALAEQKRIECLDKICQGDIEPKFDHSKEFVFKLNGQWYIGPRAYGGYGGAFAFFWPSKSPRHSSAPEFVPSSAGVASNFYDVAVEVFLTGRQGWPSVQVVRSSGNLGWENRWNELQAQGMRMEKTKIHPDLEKISFTKNDGNLYRMTYYAAIARKRIGGEGVPVASCDSEAHEFSRCTAGEFWQPDVYADFRFNAKHAQDWPAIHEEIVRVLSLLKKAQP